MKKLPTLYKNTSSIIKNHNKEYCYINKEESINKDSIKDNINSLINNPNLYQIPLIIKTKNKTYVTRLIGITNEKLVTIYNEEIIIDDIISIEK